MVVPEGSSRFNVPRRAVGGWFAHFRKVSRDIPRNQPLLSTYKRRLPLLI
jgi:hypothetical protein